MNLIALVDKKWGIANKGRELVDIPEDKKLFREETYGKVVIMGRKTLEALPNQSALDKSWYSSSYFNNSIVSGRTVEKLLVICLIESSIRYSLQAYAILILPEILQAGLCLWLIMLFAVLSSMAVMYFMLLSDIKALMVHISA